MEQQALTSEAVTHFGTYWIEAGHHIREQVADDEFLMRLLRKMLPPYKGEGIELFRGENLDRWKSGAIGLAWTMNIDTARMFAGGLNAVCSGGVLLRAHVEPAAIISGPNTHSGYLGEAQFTVDPNSLRHVSALEFFPPIEKI